MKRGERKIYCRCIAIMAVYIISAVYFYTLPTQAHTAQITENVPYLDEAVSGEEFTTDDGEVAKKGQIRENTPMSAMPCEDPEAFKEWLETYEQETGEEARVEIDFVPDSREDVPQEVPTVQSSEVETSAEVESGSSEEVSEACSFYSVNDETLNPELQRYLYSRLQEFGCEWFFRYSLCQLYQESRYDSNAVGKSGLDCGLCQFRYPYFPSVAEEAGLVEYDIFNPIDSIYVYTYLMCKYLNGTGGDVAMSLSLYYSGYGGPYSSEYVRDVTQWFETMKEVEQ